MGPRCPHCYGLYEWTESEIEEQIFGPKIYFCSDCFQMFILDPEQIIKLQEECRKQINKSSEW